MQARSLWLALLTLSLSCGRVSRSEHTAPASSDGGGATAVGGSDGIGSVGQPNADADAGAGGADESSAVTVQPSSRLTNVEFANSVSDLLGVAVSEPLEAQDNIAGYAIGLSATESAIRHYHAAAIQVAAAAIQNEATLVPCSPSQISADGAGCAAKFIDSVAPQLFRRPLNAATRIELNQVYTTIAAQFGFDGGIQAVLEELLQSPNFLYHLELEERDLGLGNVPVSGYSMSSRLSYLLWSSTPDAELLAQAAAGKLSTPEQIHEQATRMLQDVKANAGLRNFYEQWLGVTDLPETKGGAYASYNAAQRASILASFRAQADDALWSQTTGLSQLLAGDTAFYDANTAGLLGLQLAPTGPLQAGKVDPTHRLGILTHPAVMASFASHTGSDPLKRGSFIWDRILCQELPAPPPNEPAFSGVPSNTSLRHAIEAFDAPSECQQCHARIDPVGFLFENYDTLGAYRTVDDGLQTIDPAVTVVGAKDPTLNGPVANAVAFAKRLAASDQVSACFVKQLFRYASRREDAAADQTFLAELATRYVRSGQSTQQLRAALTQTQTFLRRINEE